MGTLLESGLSGGDERQKFHVDDDLFLERYNQALAVLSVWVKEQYGQEAADVWGMRWATEACRMRVMREVITAHLEEYDEPDPRVMLESLTARESECSSAVH